MVTPEAWGMPQKSAETCKIVKASLGMLHLRSMEKRTAVRESPPVRDASRSNCLHAKMSGGRGGIAQNVIFVTILEMPWSMRARLCGSGSGDLLHPPGTPNSDVAPGIVTRGNDRNRVTRWCWRQAGVGRLEP